MKKRAFILSTRFLMGLILAIMMIALLGTLYVKLRTLGDQDKESFSKFVRKIKVLEDGFNGEKKVAVIVLEKGQAIVYFEPNKEQVQVKVDADEMMLHTNYNIFLKRPETRMCEVSDGCICLFRTPEFDVEAFTTDEKVIVEQKERPLCDKIETLLSINDCGIGTPNDVNSYLCSNGFMIERHLADKSSWLVGSYYEANRRQEIQLEKMADRIILEG